MDVFNLIATNYNSSEQYDGPTNVPYIVFRGGYSIQDEKIYSEKRLRFSVRSAWDAYDATQFASMRNGHL